jgi:hypothetical protein
MQVGRRSVGPKARAIGLKILHHALHVVAGLGERDALNPVDCIDPGFARVAVLCYSSLNLAAPGIVAGERQEVGTLVILEQGCDQRGVDCLTRHRTACSTGSSRDPTSPPF